MKTEHTATLKNECSSYHYQTILKLETQKNALVDACKSLIRSYEYHCPDAKDQSLAIKNAKHALKLAE